MLTVCRTFVFDAAHRLPNYNGKCANLHGHRWSLEVEIAGPIRNNGFIMDFNILKKIVDTVVIEGLDHEYINDRLDNPTAENMTDWIQVTLSPIFKAQGVTLARIRLYETPNSYCEWRNDKL